MYNKEKKQRGISAMKNIYFDLDGTLADLYGINNWLDYLLNEYLLLLEINPRKKGYIFANLLNIKNIRGGINEISIGIQPFETFIEGKSK